MPAFLTLLMCSLMKVMYFTCELIGDVWFEGYITFWLDIICDSIALNSSIPIVGQYDIQEPYLLMTFFVVDTLKSLVVRIENLLFVSNLPHDMHEFFKKILILNYFMGLKQSDPLMKRMHKYLFPQTEPLNELFNSNLWEENNIHLSPFPQLSGWNCWGVNWIVWRVDIIL